MDDCQKIRELLSDYVDGVLDDETRDLVDQHLLVCTACREEMESMQSLVEELKSLEPVQAPEDFLDQLHERMIPRFSHRRMLRALFVPSRIKIPLELATALTAAIMIFSILTIQQSETEVAGLHEKVGAGRAMEQVGGMEKPIEVVLVLEKMDIVEQKPGSLGESAPSLSPKASGQILRKTPTEGENRSASQARSPAPLSESVAGDRAVSQIRSLIEMAEGRVISTEDDSGGGLPTILVAEIPSKNYAMFLDGLASMGKFVSPAPTRHAENEQALPVRIRILPPTDEN
jgi:hypothetical protein